KGDLVRRALVARGIEDVEIRPIVTSPPRSRRRVALSAKRTRKGAVIGLNAIGTNTILPIDTCGVATRPITDALPSLERLVMAGASRSGTMRLTVTDTLGGLDVAVEGGKPVEGGLYGELIAISATSDFARLSWEGEVVVVRRAPEIQIGSALVQPPPGGFLQATASGEAALWAGVREAVGDARRVADLFAGAGTFSLPLAQRAEVHAVEGISEALEALDTAWRRTEGLKKIGTETRDLYHRPLLPMEFKPFDAVVLDPPRQGARAQCEHLAKAEVKRIAAASCNPATFARDVRLLIDGGYQLDWVQPIDQFLWSPHVELIAALSRK
ncbi:MAG: class I SAM-dependent RNA methyltransferase, partial [Pseudomonadota bacterium]